MIPYRQSPSMAPVDPDEALAREVVRAELFDGEALLLTTPPGVVAEQKFTQPPPRYNEGSLVRELEERGIGRPSTYAEIISKVQARDYVEKLDGRTFKPSELGKMVVDGLVEGLVLPDLDDRGLGSVGRRGPSRGRADGGHPGRG